MLKSSIFLEAVEGLEFFFSSPEHDMIRGELCDRFSSVNDIYNARPPIHLLHRIKSILCYEEEGPVSYE